VDAQLRCSAELQLSRTLWNHMLSLQSTSGPAETSAAAAVSSAQQTLTQVDILSAWLTSPLLRAYGYSDDEIIRMITHSPSIDGKYDLGSFRAGFFRAFSVAQSKCSVEDISLCAHPDVQQQQQQLNPLVIDIGSSVGYFPFLSLSLGAIVYVPSSRCHYLSLRKTPCPTDTPLSPSNACSPWSSTRWA
jgi:hypothetical protein